MFNIFKKVIDASNESQRYYQNQFNTKLNEIDHSFDQLRKTTSDVIKQASTVNQELTRNVELFEKRFTTIANTIDNVIIIKTINRQWIAVNDFTCRLLEIVRESCVGRNNQQIVEQYPQLKSIIDILDNAEKHSWKRKQTETISMTIKDQKYQVIIRPIETTDKMSNELVLIGKKVG